MNPSPLKKYPINLPQACFLLGALAVVSLQASTADADKYLTNYIGQLESLRTLHLVAIYKIRGYGVETNDPVVANVGKYEFWADNGNYRISIIPLGSKNSISYDLAYNGKNFAWFNKQSKYMVVSTNHTSTNPMTIPNPILYPIDFLTPDSDACPACLLQFAEAKDPSRATSREVLRITTNNSLVTIDLKGASINNQEFFWRVTYGNSPIPQEIARVSTDGVDVISRLIFPMIVTTNGKQWPKRVRYTGRANNRSVEADIDILVIEENPPVDSSLFTLDTSKARILVNGDTGQFLRTRRTYKAKPWVRVLILAAAALPLPVYFLVRKRSVPSKDLSYVQ